MLWMCVTRSPSWSPTSRSSKLKSRSGHVVGHVAGHVQMLLRPASVNSLTSTSVGLALPLEQLQPSSHPSNTTSTLSPT